MHNISISFRGIVCRVTDMLMQRVRNANTRATRKRRLQRRKAKPDTLAFSLLLEVLSYFTVRV